MIIHLDNGHVALGRRDAEIEFLALALADELANALLYPNASVPLRSRQTQLVHVLERVLEHDARLPALHKQLHPLAAQ